MFSLGYPDPEPPEQADYEGVPPPKPPVATPERLVELACMENAAHGDLALLNMRCVGRDGLETWDAWRKGTESWRRCLVADGSLRHSGMAGLRGRMCMATRRFSGLGGLVAQKFRPHKLELICMHAQRCAAGGIR